jgi:uncharacterized membrane protein YdbT with pleckstrin-like domain
MSSPADPAPQAERVIARLRPHARALFWPSLALVAVCGAVGYFGGTFAEQWQNLAVYLGAALIALLLFLLPLAVWLGKHYTITTRRVVVRRGFFVRERREVLHSRGYQVSLRRHWLQSAFRSGDLSIDSGLERPIVLKDVPRAGAVQAALGDLMENGLAASRRQQEYAAYLAGQQSTQQTGRQAGQQQAGQQQGRTGDLGAP